MDITATFTENLPTVVDLLIDKFEGDLSNWNTDWDLVSGWPPGSYSTSPSHSVECDNHDNLLTSHDLNTADADYITISFNYRIEGVSGWDDVYVQFYDGSHYDNIE